MENNLEKPLGIIDALYGGFELVLKRPWVLLIPIALDLFLWMGPRVTATSIFQQFIAWVTSVQPPNSSPEMVQNFETTRDAFLALGAKFNVFSVAALIAIGMPSLMKSEAPDVSFLRSQQGGVAISDSMILTGLIALMIVLGILVWSVYLETLARGVRRDKGGSDIFVLRAFKSYISVGAFVVFGFFVAALIMLPFALSAMTLLVFDQSIGLFLLLLGMMMVMWAGFYLSFAVPAIFVSGANLWQAVVSSVTVFRYNFWSAIGLLSIIYLINVGFQIIWRSLIASAWGVLAADVANAFLGSALIGALMLFYYDRITWLNRIREQIRQQRPTH